MKEIRIMVRCVSSPTQHAKVVRVRAKLGRRKAEELAELLDGSSLAYVHPPGPNSPIGRCCQCGGQVEAEVQVIENSEMIPPTSEESQEAAARRDKAAQRKLKTQMAATVKHG